MPVRRLPCCYRNACLSTPSLTVIIIAAPRLRPRPLLPLRPSSFLVTALLLISVLLSVDAFLQPLAGSRRGGLLHQRRQPHRHLQAAGASLPPGVAVPEHLALVLDGNGRWAQQRGLPRGAGHMEGAKRVFEVLKACQVRNREGGRTGRGPRAGLGRRDYIP